MPNAATQIYCALVVAWAASFYQFFLRDFFSTTFGVGRVIQPIEDFPYSCRRIEHPRLEACEDLWLDNDARVLYAACAGTEGRLAWNQAINKVNATGRRPGGSELIALSIDEPGADGLFNLRAIKPRGYRGATGDDTLDLLGFDAEILDGDTINFYFVNQRPPIGAFNNVIDASVLGANTTIEVFEMRRGEESMRHLRTVHSPALTTPNRVAVLGKGEFLVTNDHSARTGLRKELDPIIGGGNVAFCDVNGDCHTAVSGDEADKIRPPRSDEPKYKTYLNQLRRLLPKPKLKFPNGLTVGFDGLVYLPSSVDGRVRVYAVEDSSNQKNILEQWDTIYTGMPLDNISPDANGDLWVPGFPSMMQTMKSMKDPYNEIAPVTIMRIRKTVDYDDSYGLKSIDYRVEKVVEDRDGTILNGATTVRHDVKTGRLFIGAAVHPYLMICEPKSA